MDRNRNANPLTGLPGNLEIQRELDCRIETKKPFAAIYADLDDFKAYNDVYGFLKGDIAIKLTADILSDETGLFGGAFIGHIGGDDFIAIVGPPDADAYCMRVIAQFDTRIRALYSAEDLERGMLVTYNRKGELVPFPIMSISLAVVTSEHRSFLSHLQVSDIAAELKKKAKSITGSIFVKELLCQ